MPPGVTDSDDIVRPFLAENFRLVEHDLGTEDVLSFLAQAISTLPKKDEVNVVSLVGGAASGKSTLATRLVAALQNQGIVADAIGTDNFCKGDRAWRWATFEGDNPQDPAGKYDFELLNQKVQAIKENKDPNKAIAVPAYDQATGLAADAGEENYTHKIGAIDVLIVEGDFHPLEQPDLVVFIHMPDAARLQSRVERDIVHRNGEEAKTTANFMTRHHRQHVPYTLLAINRADVVLDVMPTPDGWRYNVYRRE